MRGGNVLDQKTEKRKELAIQGASFSGSYTMVLCSEANTMSTLMVCFCPLASKCCVEHRTDFCLLVSCLLKFSVCAALIGQVSTYSEDMWSASSGACKAITLGSVPLV